MSIREYDARASAGIGYANNSIFKPLLQENEHSFWVAHVQVQKAASQDQSIKATAIGTTELVKPLNTVDIKASSCVCCGHDPSGTLQLVLTQQVCWIAG